MDDEQQARRAEYKLQLRELVRHPGWAVLTDLAEAKVEAKHRQILGGIDDYGRYRRAAGWCEGALAVLRIPDEVERLP